MNVKTEGSKNGRHRSRRRKIWSRSFRGWVLLSIAGLQISPLLLAGFYLGQILVLLNTNNPSLTWDDIKQIGGIFKTRNVLKYIANILLNTSGGQEMDAALTVSLKKRKPNDEVSVSSLARQQELSRKINFSIMGIDSLSRGH
ncbi:hypothetical protein C2G38_2153813 [Gigaspora rosea]|uniref:Uncharacterized protein n=1 Tax=Gigaspora rosea TaxID=44941 RepID=A0A397WBD6_9GLOM|nr:hypothetical protein C2G38_2153813 [Gigaspora rosea]